MTTHFIKTDWEMTNLILQRRAMNEQHTSTHLTEKLQEAVGEWLEKPRTTIAVTTDNARNMVNAVNEVGLGPHIECFAHALNLASQKGMAVQQISQLLGKKPKKRCLSSTTVQQQQII